MEQTQTFLVIVSFYTAIFLIDTDKLNTISTLL